MEHTHKAKAIGRFLRRKTISCVVVSFLVFSLGVVSVSIVSATRQNIAQVEAKTSLNNGFEDLTICIRKPVSDYAGCLQKLSVVSKQLDTYKGATPKEAIAWGAAQIYLFDLKAEKYPEIHDTLQQWALIEKYVNRTAATPLEFRQMLVNSYLKNKAKAGIS